MKSPNRLDFTAEQVEDLLNRIENKKLEEQDFPLLADLIRALVWMEGALREKELSIVRLRKIFGVKTESAQKLKALIQGQASSEIVAQLQSESNTNEPSQAIATQELGVNTSQPKDATTTQKDKKHKGHGHRSADEYQEAKIINIAHESLKKGNTCPDCGRGKLYNLTPGTVLRIVGQPWLGVEIYRPERLRCAKCQRVFTAKLPEEVASQGRADISAKAIVTLLKYRAGVPFYRQQQMQKILGKPLSATEIWEMTEDVADCAFPIFSTLCKLAANAECIHNDDTTAKILSCMKENKEDQPERTGTFTTVLLAKMQEKKIALFFTGRQHAGENLNDVLDKRDKTLNDPIQCCDALSRNTPKDHHTEESNCNAHARRNFYELAEKWPKEVLQIISWYDMIFFYDRQVKKEKMDKETALKLHQEHSQPYMNKIKEYCQNLLNAKLVEPNSSLGKAIQYFNNHWEKLTLFLRMPGVPLTNNDAERLIKRAVLNRKNAYFFKNETGARIADVLFSIIETCAQNGANPWDYLIAIQKHASLVVKDPMSWLPWNYQKAIVDTS